MTTKSDALERVRGLPKVGEIVLVIDEYGFAEFLEIKGISLTPETERDKNRAVSFRVEARGDSWARLVHCNQKWTFGWGLCNGGPAQVYWDLDETNKDASCRQKNKWEVVE